VGNTTRENYIQIICDGWNQIGLSCSTNPTSFGTLVTQLLGGEYTGFIMLGLTGVDPAGGSNVVPCGTALHLNHVNCDPDATSGPDAPDASQLAVEEAFLAGFAATSVADAQPAFDQMQIAWAENQPWLQLAIQNGLFALRTDRICNTGNTSYSNLDLKFRLDLAGNETSCTTNPQ